ncbi:MAG TPA: carboxypeptidase-like regulatory domain-containing protein [Gaiellaceae bacterium]|nr:carboxypeptidase-like regulatory domain-containing protein [Gaiellaceae bacterium]
MFTKRGVLVAAVLVGAAIATVVAASATTHASPAQQLLERGTAQQRSTLGSGKASPASVRARTAVRGHLPKAAKRSRPQQLHLKAAHSKVFDVRKLRGLVVRKERPERTAPGFAPLGTRAAKALENPTRVAPQLPRVIKQSQMVSAAAPAPDSSFDGLDFANWGAGHPPDENGDVGPTYYIQTVNTSIGIYNKSTGTRVAAFTFNSFMSQGHFGNLCDTDNFGDPVVLYDSFENRWFITDFAFKLDASGNVVNPPGAFQCFAVSKTGDPVNGGWNFYSIAAPGALNDYPKFGVWPDGIYMSANMFGYPAGGSYLGYHVWALNKQQMYAGAPSPQVVDFAGDSSDFTVIPANARLQAGTPTAGEPEYFVSTEQFLNGLSIYKFHVDWDKPSTSTFTGAQTQLAPNCWPNAAVSNALTPANAADTLSIRAMAQPQYTNIGGAESLWVDHTVNRGTFALASCGGSNTNNATIRWYQANVTGGTVAANVVQGQSYDPEGANTFFRFMPSLAVDRLGDLAIGYTKSNSTTNPQVKYAGRLAGDPSNTLGQSEQTLIDGSGAQSGNCGGAACTRWGDYSGMSLDPNGCEFWMTGEYYATTGLNDLTRIGSFKLNPACTPVGNGTLSGTVTDGTNPVAGATVSLGSRTTTANGSGTYSFTVPAGTYASLTASKAGFDDGSAATIAVPDGGTATRNFTLAASAQSGCFSDNTQSTFQRGAPSNCDLVSSPGSVVLAAPDNTAARNNDVSPSGFGFSNTSWAGQTFTPTVSGQLKRVDVELFCASCTANSPNVTLSIRNTTGTTPVPTGADLGTATLAGFNDGGAGGLKTFTFATPVAVTAGTRYALVFRLASAFASGTVAYTCSCATTGFSDTNPYASGQRVTSTNSGTTWTADTTAGGRDLSFVTYVNPGFASSGTYVSSLKDANPAAGRTPTWTTLSFTATQPAGTSVKFQVAGSNSQYGPFTFVGPDGTANTFFTTSGASLSQFDGLRYLKYEAFLSTGSGSVTPTLSSVSVCFADTTGTSPTALAAAGATGTYGGTTSLSATLTSGGSPVSGESVGFTLNGSSVGSATTNGSGVATLANVSLAGINAGTYATGVSASFAGDGSFAASSGSGSLTVNRADQAITVTTHAPASAVFNGQFTVAAAGGGSGNAVAFSSSGACSNTGATFTMTGGTGTCSVKYDQAGNANYNAAPQVTESVTAQKADQTITVTQHAPSAEPFNGQFTVAATAPGGSVGFSSAGACTNSGATYTITAASGTCSVEYDQAGNANYNAAPQVVESVTAGKQAQSITITLHAPSTALYGGTFSVAATGGGSGNAVTFSSGGACSNNGAAFTMTSGTGACTVRFDQAGNDQYADAPELTETVTAQKAGQTITVTTHAPSSAVYGSGFPVAGAAPGGPVSFTSAGACSNSGATFTMTGGTGTCSVKYDQAGDANYDAAPQVTESVTAQKADQTITVTTHAPASVAYNSNFSVAASAPGGSVTFSSAGSCSNTGASFTMTSSSATCSVEYDQAGNANYNAAPQVTESVNATKANQAIVITLHAPVSAAFGSTFSVAASGGGAGNPVTFSSSGACSNSGDTFTMTSGTGTCSVEYDQAGDANYNAAPQVGETTTAQKAGQTIAFAPLPDRTVGDPDFTVGATASSGLAVSFAASGQCTVSGTTVHLTGAGSCTITASQGGDSNYAAASDVPRTFQINPAQSASQITDTTATCQQFGAGTAATLGSVFYSSKGGKISKETPSKLTYWVKLTVPAGAHRVEIDQAITSGNFSRKLDLATGSLVFTAACGKVRNPVVAAGANGSVTVDFTAAAGTYFVAVRYAVTAVNGQREPSPTTVHYELSTVGVAGSTSGLDLKKTLTAAPARMVRAALFAALRR